MGNVGRVFSLWIFAAIAASGCTGGGDPCTGEGMCPAADAGALSPDGETSADSGRHELAPPIRIEPDASTVRAFTLADAGIRH